MFLAYRYDIVEKKYESYGLKPIIKKENLETPGRTFYDASTIKTNIFIPEERKKIIDYAKDDADDSLKLLDLMAPPFFYMAWSIPKSFQAITESAPGSQINTMLVRSYLQQGHSIPKASEVVPFEGAISDGYAGIYKNCIKWDVASLYPSIMIEHSVGLGAKDPSSNFQTLVHYFTSERLKNKKLAKTTGEKYYDDLQAAQKILINSFYGFLSTNGLQFNSPEGAAFVTAQGREYLKKAVLYCTGKEYISSDTKN
jgi:DNA polymerase elongation subunit (family B)